MPTIATFLTYNDQAEEAANLYTSIFPDSRISNTTRFPEIPCPPAPGSVMTVELALSL